MAVEKIWSTRKLLADFSTFVGDAGEIFFNPENGTLRISDGVTPGGQPLPSYGSLTELSDVDPVSAPDDGKFLYYDQATGSFKWGSVNLTELSNLTYLDFNLGAGHSVTQGQLAWNADEETLDLGLNGAVLQLGQETHYHVRNNSGADIPNGSAVMATGTIGNSSRITIDLMNNDGSLAPYYFLGIATEDIQDGTDGKVTHFGKIRGIQTNGLNYGEVWNDGDLVYLSANTPGALTTTAPSAPSAHQPVAIVIHAHSNGSLFIRVPGNAGLHELHDVDVDAVANNQIMAYDSDGVWRPRPVLIDPALQDAENVYPGAFRITGSATGAKLELNSYSQIQGIYDGTYTSGIVLRREFAEYFGAGYIAGVKHVAIPSDAVLAFKNSSAAINSGIGVALARDANDILAQRNGANAQEFRLYNTYTDASNYERGGLKWNANILEIGTSGSGTGSTSRHMAILPGGNLYINPGSSLIYSKTLLAYTTKTTDLGGTSNRWRYTYLGSDLTGSSANSTLDIASTWNTTGTPTLIKADVTDTASDASSLLMDLQVGGSSVFTVRKDGKTYINGANGSLTGNANLSADQSAFRVGWLVNSVTGGGAYGGHLSGAATGHVLRTIAGKDIRWTGNASNDNDIYVQLVGLSDYSLEQRNGTNAQEFRLYNTYTDASNYERGFFRYATNVLEIGHEAAGTGTSGRTIKFITAGFAPLTLTAAAATMGVNVDMNAAALFNAAQLGMWERNADPSNPAEGRCTIWQSDGTGSGDDGDLMAKITSNSVTKTVTLISKARGGADIGISIVSVTSDTYTVNAFDGTETYISVNNANPTTITINGTGYVDGQRLIVKDKSGAAAINNIIVTANSTTIDGESTATIAVNYGSITLYYADGGWNII